MQKPLILALSLATFGLAACGDTDLERGASGAAIGAVGTAVVGGDPIVGAAVGGAAGVLCDDLTPELCN